MPAASKTWRVLASVPEPAGPTENALPLRSATVLMSVVMVHCSTSGYRTATPRMFFPLLEHLGAVPGVVGDVVLGQRQFSTPDSSSRTFSTEPPVASTVTVTPLMLLDQRLAMAPPKG